MEVLPLNVPNEWDSTQVAEVVQEVLTSDDPHAFGGTLNARPRFQQWTGVGPSLTAGGAAAPTASQLQRKSFSSDEVVVTDSNQVVWRSRPQLSFKDRSNRLTLTPTPFPEIRTTVGLLREDGWVYFENSGRYTLTAVKQLVKQYQRATHAEIVDALNGIRSPFEIDAQSNQLGVFIGGTSMHFYGLGNVERLYNLYQGTKFYYGGIGNAVDYQAQTLSSATGWGWDAILDRAEADILAQYRPGMRIHLFGFSRGAAMCNDLAMRSAQRRSASISWGCSIRSIRTASSSPDRIRTTSKEPSVDTGAIM